MINLTFKTSIEFIVNQGKEVTKITTEASPIKISVTEYFDGTANDERIAAHVVGQADAIRKVANFLCSKQ